MKKMLMKKILIKKYLIKKIRMKKILKQKLKNIKKTDKVFCYIFFLYIKIVNRDYQKNKEKL